MNKAQEVTLRQSRATEDNLELQLIFLATNMTYRRFLSHQTLTSNTTVTLHANPFRTNAENPICQYKNFLFSILTLHVL
jgi:hypothetical protein